MKHACLAAVVLSIMAAPTAAQYPSVPATQTPLPAPVATGLAGDTALVPGSPPPSNTATGVSVERGAPGAAEAGRIANRADGETGNSDSTRNNIAPTSSGDVAGTWQAEGPAPAVDGQTENVVPNDEVAGAVHVVLPHPTNPDIVYIGGVNSGVWKTTDATAASPDWTQTTDQFPSLSIGAMAFDSADSTHQTLYAGIGRFSSLGGRGGDRTGLLKSTDGGDTWTAIDGGGTLIGKNISGLAVTGDEIVISVNFAATFTFDNIGIFRSTDGGDSFTGVSEGDGSTTGLPSGASHDLVRDPSEASRLYTSVIFADIAGGANGLYRSDDFGASWTKVSNAAIDALFLDGDGNNVISNIEFAVGNSGSVFVGLAPSGRLGGVFHSTDNGASWTEMDLPTTTEDGVDVGIHPGGQASIHMSIATDPTDSNIVYMGGDRQPSPFPNSIGANTFSGRLFRGDASAAAGSQWTPLTHVGTNSDSSPHADSREIAFNANGTLIETDDGGVYRRTQPQSSTGDWFSMNANLASTEYHGVAYDAVSDIIIGGAQDTGTTEQMMPGTAEFISVSTADGGDPVVDDHSSTTQSTRYSSFQFLGAFRRRDIDAGNNVLNTVFPDLTVLGGGDALEAQFYTPLKVNAVNGSRLLIGAANSLYESLDEGDTITEIAPGQRVNAFVGDPIIYGVPGNPDLIYVAATFESAPNTREQVLLTRSSPPPASLTQVTLPATETIVDLAINPQSPTQLFAMTRDAVFSSTDSGNTWTDISGDLATLDPGSLRSMAFVSGTPEAVVVGANRGTFIAFTSGSLDSWSRLGSDLPNAPVFELEYDAADDVLLAGLLGRGAWTLDEIPAPNQAPSAQDDSVATDEDTALNGDILADNGNGTDSDPEGDPLDVTEVNGESGNIDTQITLSSGALLIVNGDGTFTYDPNEQFETLGTGDTASDSFTYTISDGNGGSDSATVTVTINGVDDPPVAVDDSATVDEDAPAPTIDVLINDTDIDGGQMDILSVTQPVNANVVNNTTNVAYTPDTDYCNDGSPTDDFTYTLNGGSTATVSVSVTCVNDAPSFTPGGDLSVLEDSGSFSQGWANAISPGPANESGQSVTFEVNNDNNALFSAQPAIDPSGTLTFVPAEDANGSATVTVTLTDDGGTDNDGDDTSPVQSLTITVDPLNDPPRFTAGGDVQAFENAAFSEPWASDISPGPADESDQSVSFTVTNNTNPGLFGTGPAVDPGGQLTFTPTPNTTGSAEITVTAEDDGGSPNGGDPVSDPATFTINVSAADVDLAVDKISGTFFTQPGGTLTYTIEVTNAGPTDVVDALFQDDPPTRLGNLSWSCAAQGQASCETSGTGAIDELVEIPAGDSVVFTLDATLQDNSLEPITNVATVTAPSDVNDIDTSNNTDSDTDEIALFFGSFESEEPD